jgi:hypothetical protein
LAVLLCWSRHGPKGVGNMVSHYIVALKMIIWLSTELFIHTVCLNTSVDF